MMLVFVSLWLCLSSFLSGSGGLESACESSTCGGFDPLACNENDRQTLLRIKANLVDFNDTLRDWEEYEPLNPCCKERRPRVKSIFCCEWRGVSCNYKQQVTAIDLSDSSISLASDIGHLIPLLHQLEYLVYLDFSGMDFKFGPVLNSLSSLTNLTQLRISAANLNGSIPQEFAKLSNLFYLDLSSNSLSGAIPSFFGELTSLMHLDLSKNRLTGNLPVVGNLSDLRYLDVSSNFLEGVISDIHFQNLTGLDYLDLSSNSFVLNLSSHFRFRNLTIIKLQSCKLGPSFPMWIQDQMYYKHLDISNTGIADHIPVWFWNLPEEMIFLNISSNEMKGILPNMTSIFQNYPGMDLSHNQLEGAIPTLPSKLAALNLAGNRFSGTLSFLCQIDSLLTFLDLSNNLFSGGLPDCWLKFKEHLVVLNLSDNNLTGEIPSSLGFLSRLQALYLRRNAFAGKVPMSLSKCTKLKFVDLGENKLSGNIPSWIGETLSELSVLVLRVNRFEGNLPSQICWLNKLQFLDVSKNGLSGNIPRCLGNLTAMATRGLEDDIMTHSYTADVRNYTFNDGSIHFCALHWHRQTISHRPTMWKYMCESNVDGLFIDNAMVVWKGTQREFGRGLYLLKCIDMSSNKFRGKLPDEITNLRELVSLNFSNNELHGPIPHHIDQLRYLEALDLSRNKFLGNIPSSLSLLTLLSCLDLSYNNLSGRIPVGTQLQLSNSSYNGNPQLCGLPLTKRCELPPPPATFGMHDIEEDRDNFWESLYTGMSVGFIVGFWGICGALFLNRGFRYVFFATLDNMNDWMHVTFAVVFWKLHQKIT